MKFDLNNFTIIKKRVNRSTKVSEPLVSLGQTGFTFNSYLIKHTSVVNKYVQIRVDAALGKVAFIFSTYRLDDSFTVSTPGGEKSVHLGSASVTSRSTVNYLNRKTDLVNTSVYRYRFMAKISEEQGIIMIDLLNPYTKEKIASKS